MRSHGSKEINELLDHLEEKLGGPMDGTEQQNRRYCHLLLSKVRKQSNKDPVLSIKALIDVIFSGHSSMRYHERRTTSFTYLFYRSREIVNAYRAGANGGLDSYRQQVAIEANKRFGSGAEPPGDQATGHGGTNDH